VIRRHRRQRAQGLIEFALMAPFFLLIVTMVFDFARAAWIYSSLSGVVREGGRQAILAQYGASNPTDATILSRMTAWAPQLSLSAASCIHGWTASPTIHTPAAGNTGYIYILAGSLGTANAPSGQTSGSAGAGCVSHIPAGLGANPLKIEVVYNFQPMTPFASQFMPGGITMTVTSTMYTEF
jgi:TadE-like protein